MGEPTAEITGKTHLPALSISDKQYNLEDDAFQICSFRWPIYNKEGVSVDHHALNSGGSVDKILLHCHIIYDNRLCYNGWTETY